MSKRKKRMTEFVAKWILIVPLALCVVIVLGLVINLGLWGPRTAEDGTHQSITLLLSVLGIAVTTWIGLNLYNVFSKEELNVLLNEAEDASNLSADMFTQVLISKLRMFPITRIENYFAERLVRLERLPVPLLKELIEVEDCFTRAYEFYVAKAYAETEEQGKKRTDRLADTIEKGTDYELTENQRRFLTGMLAVHQGDYLYFKLLYGNTWQTSTEDERKSMAESTLAYYKKGLSQLFYIDDFRRIDQFTTIDPGDKQGLSILANDICGYYLQLEPEFVRSKPKQNEAPWNCERIQNAVLAGEIAVKCCDEVSPGVRAIICRNLGAAYERQSNALLEGALMSWGDEPQRAMRLKQSLTLRNKAFDAYCKSIQMEPRDVNTCHCLASWYWKQACWDILAVGVKANYSLKLSDADIRNLRTNHFLAIHLITDSLDHAIFWYKRKEHNNGGTSEKRIQEIYQLLFRLTGDTRYCEMEKEQGEKQNLVAFEKHEMPSELPSL